MNQLNTNPSPKQRFLAIKTCVDHHRELVQRPDFQLALDYAQDQIVWEKAGGNGAASVPGNDAAANFYKLQGVHEFIRTLKTLAEQPTVVPMSTAGEIDHTFK